MANLVDHAANRGRVLQLHRGIDLAQSEPPRHELLVVFEPDWALDQLDRDGLPLRVSSLVCHDYALAREVSSSSSLPRNRAINTGSFKEPRPVNVARTTLCGFAEPSDLVRMLVIPADSTTARTAPPAMMPVPSGAGFNNTLPDPNLPTMRCGIVVPASGTRIKFFFAASIPFLMADGTSFALPTPKPTTPCPSPTTTNALKLRFLPPLTTFVTRLIETTVSLISSWDASMRSRLFNLIRTPSRPCARRQPRRESARDRETRRDRTRRA